MCTRVLDRGSRAQAVERGEWVTRPDRGDYRGVTRFQRVARRALRSLYGKEGGRVDGRRSRVSEESLLASEVKDATDESSRSGPADGGIE